MINCCNCFVQALFHACFTPISFFFLSLSVVKSHNFFSFYFSLSLSLIFIHSNREEVVHRLRPHPQSVMDQGERKVRVRKSAVEHNSSELSILDSLRPLLLRHQRNRLLRHQRNRVLRHQRRR